MMSYEEARVWSSQLQQQGRRTDGIVLRVGAPGWAVVGRQRNGQVTDLPTPTACQAWAEAGGQHAG